MCSLITLLVIYKKNTIRHDTFRYALKHKCIDSATNGFHYIIKVFKYSSYLLKTFRMYIIENCHIISRCGKSSLAVEN